MNPHRSFHLKHPDARPLRTDRWYSYLGYRVSRRGLRPGPKMLGRVSRNVEAKEPEALRASVAAMAAAWTWGS
ncbi:MAG: hypothetical protein H6739_15630 [Alphaproteobacteria bacterium]|nr:hypothetical protein [Alphaproteobacteria bacterium]